MRTSSAGGIQVLHRALGLLRAFSDQRPAWRLSELAQHAGLAKPTAFRILATLADERVVVRDPTTGSYRLGPTIIAIGALARRTIDLPALARPELEALAWSTGETTCYEVLEGTEILIVDGIAGRFRTSSPPGTGSRWPAHATSTGKALLADLRRTEPAAWARYTKARRSLPRYTTRTLTSIARLSTDLDLVDRRGYAIADEELELGYTAIGTLIRDSSGDARGAISVGGATGRLRPSRRTAVIREMLTAAKRISQRLGAVHGSLDAAS